MRYEGLPTVPRGTKGERNRKFIKTNPDGTPLEGGAPADARPAYTGRDERRSFEEGGAGNRPRPEGGSFERRDERPARREFGSRPGGEERRGSFGDRRPAGSEGGERRSFGNREGRPSEGGREERRSSYGNDRGPGRERTEGAFGKPRSYGERPSNTSSGTFRERREALRAAESGPRSSTGYGRADKPKFGEKPGEAPDYKNLKHYEQDKTRGNKRRLNEEDFGNEELRLNRYIANAGICSRREADALIAAGEIRVNGEVITEMGYKVQPTDTVQYGKTNLNREKLVYVLLNKPKDFITTTDDPEGRKTVMSLVATASKERIFPVGRLDRNTTGLLLFTNDGEVAQKLSHPSHKNKKIYQAELDKPLTAEHLAEITAGVELEDGKAEVDDVAVVAGNPHFVGIELHIGRNRIVRRIFEHLGYDVVALDRVQYAGLTKKDLPRGKWRFLSEQEVIRLKYFM
ncbi:pseudouridine synthase [Hymenobacter sp. BRD67]|uniref:pseudouridine synthase n=1 Tax=Hymenobacter sp. BRD67 TaxID=2675877 RepID=UPI0020B644DF|nr:pseudouridine synthase [Hymenobacter sp. BRD67]